MRTVFISIFLAPIGRRLDQIMGGDPNQTFGGIHGLSMVGIPSSYGTGYGYQTTHR